MDLAARRLVVFDWDGTLCDSMSGIIATARSVLLEWGIAEEDLGDPGMRQSKENYHPVKLLEKYLVKV